MIGRSAGGGVGFAEMMVGPSPPMFQARLMLPSYRNTSTKRGLVIEPAGTGLLAIGVLWLNP